MESAVMTSRITSAAFHNVGYAASTLIETSPSFFVGSSALASLDTRTRRKKPAPPTILTSAPVFRSECLRLGCLFGFSGGGWHGCHPFLETVWCLFTIFNSRSLGQEFVEQQIERGGCDGKRAVVLAHCRKGCLASSSGLQKWSPNDGLHFVLVANQTDS